MGGLVVKMNIELPEVKKEIKKPIIKEKIKPIVEKPIIKKKIKPIEEKPMIKKKETKEDIKKVEKNIESNLPKVYRPKGSSLSKKKIVGVISKDKKENKVLSGPIDELYNLSLANFRHLGENAKESTDKILYKINLLEEESFTKKSEGIKAWRDNEVYKLYFQIGNDSLEKNKEVKDIIKDYEKLNKDVLTIEEFSAISDLNKLLRF